MSRLLGAIGEHPAVSAVGWDVLLSGLSLGVWAAVRGLDGKEMLGSCVPFFGTVEKEVEQIEEEVEDQVVKHEP